VIIRKNIQTGTWEVKDGHLFWTMKSSTSSKLEETIDGKIDRVNDKALILILSNGETLSWIRAK